MKKWLATVKVEIWDDYNKTNQEMSIQVLVNATNYGEASITADKYVCSHFLRNIGPIIELTDDKSKER